MLPVLSKFCNPKFTIAPDALLGPPNVTDEPLQIVALFTVAVIAVGVELTVTATDVDVVTAPQALVATKV